MENKPEINIENPKDLIELKPKTEKIGTKDRFASGKIYTDPVTGERVTSFKVLNPDVQIINLKHPSNKPRK